MKQAGVSIAVRLVSATLGVIAWAGAAGAEPSAILSTPVAVEPTPVALPAGGGTLRLAGSGEGSLAVYSTGVAVLGRRLAPNGEPLSEPFAIAQTLVADVEVVFDGTTYAVIWTTRSEADATGIFLQRVGTQGELVGARQTIFEGPDYWYIALARGESGALLVGVSVTDTRTWVIDEDSVGDGAVMPLIVGGSVEPSVGYSDGQYLAVYSDDDTYFGRIAADGTFLDDTLIQLAGAGPYLASVAPAADGFRVVWSSGYTIQSAAVSFDGVVSIDPTPPIADPDYALFYPVLAATAEGYLLAAAAYDCLTCEPASNQIVYALSKDFAVASKALLDGEYGTRDPPAVVIQQGAAVVAWASGNDTLFSRAVSLDVSLLGPGPNELAMQASVQRDPKGAPGGDGWLVVWQESSFDNTQRESRHGLVASRLDDAGRPRGQPVVLDDVFGQVVDVSGSSAGWMTGLYDPSVRELSVVFLAAAGEVGARQLVGSSDNLSIRFARTSEGWLLVWDEGDVIDQTYTVMVSAFDVSGQLLETRAVSSSSSLPHAVDVAVVENEYRALWSADDDSIVFQRLEADGTPIGEVELLADPVGDPIRVSHAATSQASWVACASYSPTYQQVLYRVPGSVGIQAFGPDQLSSLVLAGGVLVTSVRPQLTSWRAPSPVTLLLGQDPQKPLTTVAEVENTRSSHVSAGKGDRVLLSYTADAEVFGSMTERVFARFVQVVPDDEGAGGAGGATGAGGESGSEGGTPGASNVGGEGGSEEPPIQGGTGGTPGVGGSFIDGGASAAEGGGGASAAEGGGASALEGGGVPGAGDESTSPRTSKGCGCRAAGSGGINAPSLVAFASLLVVSARRRRRVLATGR